eukprot:NODE_6896_length_475_cov_2.130952.p1 GENE.NODE_6896_length_475_cov_2.130952~~NODE_6896_length_475_cov_2.130952.p1  ORF type:complete len:101 (+),score=4.45 NODE_6896_length_475_cov_2.130952:2-304(+)
MHHPGQESGKFIIHHHHRHHHHHHHHSLAQHALRQGMLIRLHPSLSTLRHRLKSQGPIRKKQKEAEHFFLVRRRPYSAPPRTCFKNMLGGFGQVSFCQGS